MTDLDKPGVIESTKKGFIRALRATFEGDYYPDDYLAGINVDIEYPATRESYPGIWVQFSFNNLQRAGINQSIYDPNTNAHYYHWRFKGTVTLTPIALTSLERDRMSDGLINLFAFGRYIQGMDTFTQSLDSYEYVAIELDQDALTPGGQSVNVGVPWDPDQLAYEDSYGINILGEFFMNTDPNAVPILLSRIDVHYTEYTVSNPGTPWAVPNNNPDGLGSWV